MSTTSSRRRRAGSASSAATSAAGRLPVKPNIILIITDQQRSLQWFPRGWEEQHLPAMTYLKQHGLSFRQSVNNTCACTPSRVCTFTGTYPSRNFSNFTLTEFFQPQNTTATPYNVPENNNPDTLGAGPYPTALSSSEPQLDQTLPNLATILAEAGYDTFYKGKYHLSKGVLGYDNLQYEPDITRYGFLQWDPPDAGQDAQMVNYGGGNADNDGRFTDDTVAFLQDRIAHPRKYRRPFCLVYSLVNPHDVLGYPNNWVDLQDNGGYGPEWIKGDIALPPTFRENLRKNYKPTSQQNWLTLMNFNGPLKGPQHDHYLNFYGNLMSLVDRHILRVLDLLRAPSGRALLENTMIVRTSDHGEMGLTHSGSRQKWFNAYQESIRVPLVWSNPLLFPQPVVSDSLVSLVDLLPTLASFCGVKRLQRFGLQGRDYSALLTNPTASVQDYTYYINTDVKAGQAIPQAALPPNHLAMVRDARFKYVRYYGGTTAAGSTSKEVQEEFYNLATDIDPGTGEAVELKNKSAWAEAQGAPWKLEPYEIKKRRLMKSLLAQSMSDGVLATETRLIAPRPMHPRAKVVKNAWGDAVATTPDVYQVICYTQLGYTYALQARTGKTWADVASTTALIPTTLAGNNGPMLFQAQPTLATRPTYRVVRTDPKGKVTRELVKWVDYTQA